MRDYAVHITGVLSSSRLDGANPDTILRMSGAIPE